MTSRVRLNGPIFLLSVVAGISNELENELIRAREWGSELRTRKGGGQNPPAISAPIKAKIAIFMGDGLCKELSRKNPKLSGKLHTFGFLGLECKLL